MDFVNCSTCTTLIPNESIFCFNCGTRVKCSSCNSLLIKDSKFCFQCGTPVRIENKEKETEKNTIVYKRTKDELFCEVSLTNEVGKEGIKGLIQNLTGNQNVTYNQLGSIDIPDAEQFDVPNLNESEPTQVDEIDHKEILINENASQFPHLNDVEMTVNCSESEWILIYAFYESDFSKKTFTKEKVHERYMSKRKTASHVSNFSKNWKSLFKNYFVTINDSEIKFRGENLTFLQNLINNKEKGSARHISKKKNNKTQSAVSEIEQKDSKDVPPKAKGKSSSLPSYTLVKDLNFYPSGKESLKNFYNQYNVTTSSKVILIIVYYLEKYLQVSNIGINTIYTCYKEIGLPVPDIHSALGNISRRDQYVDTSDRNNLKITILGENQIEHKMKKNQNVNDNK